MPLRLFKRRSGKKESRTGKDYYDAAFSSAEHWRAHYTRSPYYFVWTVIVDRLGRVRPAVILEIGCGPGQLAAAIHDAGLPDRRYVGLDFSHVALEHARGACPAQFEFVEADAISTDLYETLDYDTVISTEFLEHVEQDIDVLGKLRRGTTVIATVPNFPYVSHVRHFSDPASVAERYGPLFDDFSVTPIPGVASGTTFFLIQGRRR